MGVRTYRNKINIICNYYDTYRGNMGIVPLVNVLCFGKNYDANLELISCKASLLHRPLHTSRSEE